MAFNLRNRNFLKLLDFSTKEIQFLLELSAELKKQNMQEQSRRHFKVKTLHSSLRNLLLEPDVRLKSPPSIKAHKSPISVLQDLKSAIKNR